MNLQELKEKSPADLLAFAEELEIENASTLRKQDMMFAILKQLADNDVAIYGQGVLETLPDGFGFLRSPESNYLPGPDDIYVSPSQVRRFGLRTGDTVEGEIRAPKEGATSAHAGTGTGGRRTASRTRGTTTDAQLLARRRALLGRSAGTASATLSCGGLRLDPRTHLVLMAEHLLADPPPEIYAAEVARRNA